MLKIYKCQWIDEQRHRDLKQTLHVRPVFLHNDARIEALIAIKYQGFVDLEYEIHSDDPMPGVIASFAYMRGVLAGMR